MEVFKEDNFELSNFKLFMNDNRAAINHMSYASKKGELVETPIGKERLETAIQKMKELIMNNGMLKNGRSFKELIETFDTNKNGTLDGDEFRAFMESASNRVRFTEEEKHLIIKLADKDGNNVVSI